MSNFMNSILSIFFGIILTTKYQVQCYKHSTEPLMLLVSFDGFRWDYLKKFDLPNFNHLKTIGSHAEYIQNSFSTVTFPNHWTLVTGMYEETHGIIQNEMYDRDLKKEFHHLNSNDSNTKDWYGQNKLTEPIWISNQKAGGNRKSAAEWVGAGVSFDDQSPVFIPYNNSKPYKTLIDEFVSLYVDQTEPINFGAIYFDEPDHTGHIFGPYSKEMEDKLYSLDKTLGYLIGQLKAHGLFEQMNMIITSDHGMEEISENRAIFLDSYINTDLFNAYGSRACYSLFVKNKTDTEYIYKTLYEVENIEIFKKNEIPEHLHYKKNVRIGDLLLITKIGYSVYINNQTIDWKNNNKGDHGYNNNNTAMYPIFMSHGPAFKANYTIPTFKNVDIYPLMCFILGIQPGAGHNGTLGNVIDMVVNRNASGLNRNQRDFTLFFVILSVIVPVLFFIALFNVCCIRCQDIFKNPTSYDQLNATESNLDIENQTNDSTERILIE